MPRAIRPAPAAPPARVLGALAAGVLGPDATAELPGRMLAVLDRLPSRRDRDRLLGVLRALDTRAGALALTGSPTPVSRLGPGRAQALLRRWQASRLPLARQLWSAVSSAALFACYGHPGPARARTGYPGPPGPAPDTPRRLAPLELDQHTELACDVVVVGSGAGGGVAAGVLAGTGLDVVVVEKGGYAAEPDFHQREAAALDQLYLYGPALATTDLGCRILAGSTLGGGTVVNFTTSLPTPADVLAQWARVSGVDAFGSGEVAAAQRQVAERIGVTEACSAPARRDELLQRGLDKLGWQVAPMPRNVRGCPQDAACGWCGFGCRRGAKQSTLRTYLEDAAGRGARLVIRADVRRVLVADGHAVGVEGVAGGHRLRVRARAVVAAAGAVETPALLLRSGLGGQVGRNLHLHPGTAVWGWFDEPVRMWEGTLQARHSAQLRHLDGGWGPLLETVPVHPALGAAALPFGSAAAHRDLMGRYEQLSLVGVLPRDTTAGRVRLGREGNPRVVYRLNAADERRIGVGVTAAGEVLAAAGAVEVLGPHPQRLAWHPGPAGAYEQWAEATWRAGYRGGRVTLFSFHQMGSCRMGADPASSAVDPDQQSHELPGLYVMDASVFPTASGVNPMLSIMGLAHRAAGRLAARLA